jgi:hypothetical protein
MAPPRRLLAAIGLVALIGAGNSNAPADTGSGGAEKPATDGSPSTEPLEFKSASEKSDDLLPADRGRNR